MIKLVEGIVLKKEPVRETDEMLTLYTRELGKVRAKVVGVKKLLSKLRPLTSLFCRSSFQLYLRGGNRMELREPGKVIGGEVLQTYGRITEEWEKIIQASIWCETVNELTRAFYSHLPEYQLLHSTLAQMEKTRFPEIVRLRSTLILLKILGYSFSHHTQWKQLEASDKELFYRLAKWEESADGFTKREVEKIKEIISSYLSLYLENPLKAEIFQKKMERTG